MVTNPHPQSRRERVREATREEIKALARQQMAASGSGALALNAIARELGMVPSALYRYYADRDALITALILDAFAGLAGALRAAVGAVPAEEAGAQLRAACSAYRRWALDHPVDFQLVFGTPIPGYHAPAEQAGPAMQQVFAVFLDVLQAAHDAGQLTPVPGYSPGALRACAPGDLFSRYSPPVMYSGLSAWTLMQGVITLELNGHLRHALCDPAALYASQMNTFLSTVGLAPDA